MSSRTTHTARRYCANICLCVYGNKQSKSLERQQQLSYLILSQNYRRYYVSVRFTFECTLYRSRKAEWLIPASGALKYDKVNVNGSHLWLRITRDDLGVVSAHTHTHSTHTQHTHIAHTHTHSQTFIERRVRYYRSMLTQSHMVSLDGSVLQ